jgi:hypothetical protein
MSEVDIKTTGKQSHLFNIFAAPWPRPLPMFSERSKPKQYLGKKCRCGHFESHHYNTIGSCIYCSCGIVDLRDPELLKAEPFDHRLCVCGHRLNKHWTDTGVCSDVNCHCNYPKLETPVHDEKTTGAFWIIWNPAADKPPTTRYTSEKQARAVADKLALGNPGSEFIVLEAVASYVLPTEVVSKELK